MPISLAPTLKLEVANLSPRDALFLRDVVRLLTDPMHAQEMRAVRAGSWVITYDGTTGEAAAEPILLNSLPQ